MIEPIELFSGTISRINPQGHTIEVTLESEFGRILAEDEVAVFELYIADYVGFQVGQKVTNYIAVEELP